MFALSEECQCSKPKTIPIEREKKTKHRTFGCRMFPNQYDSSIFFLILPVRPKLTYRLFETDF